MWIINFGLGASLYIAKVEPGFLLYPVGIEGMKAEVCESEAEVFATLFENFEDSAAEIMDELRSESQSTAVVA